MKEISFEELLANEMLQINNWLEISVKCILTENQIREFQNKVDWYQICKYQKLSETFIEEFKYDIHWNIISRYQKLSESFIIKHAYKFQWDYIFENQYLSMDSIWKLTKLSGFDKDWDWNWDLLAKKYKLSNEFIDKFHDKFNWYELTIVQDISKEILDKHDYYYIV
jgi:hypothetical protein